MMDHTQIIEDTLRQLGVGGNYIAQQRAVTAIQLAIEDEDRLLYVTKNIYLPVAISAPWSSGSGASTQRALPKWPATP